MTFGWVQRHVPFKSFWIMTYDSNLWLLKNRELKEMTNEISELMKNNTSMLWSKVPFSPSRFFIAWYSQIQSVQYGIQWYTTCYSNSNYTIPGVCQPPPSDELLRTFRESLLSCWKFRVPATPESPMRGIINRIRRVCAPWRLETCQWEYVQRADGWNIEGSKHQESVYIYI